MPDIVGRLRSPRLSAPPASPAVGEMYFDTGASKLYWWNGTIWVDASGSTGPSSSWVSALSGQPILDVGVSGQIRAGRVITLADFTTTLGVSAPAGLWQLGSTGDSSGNNRNLVNKGALTFGQGVNGNDSGGAAYFTGNAGQALYVSDVGAGDPCRITSGSWGGWFKTAKRNAWNGVIGKYTAAAPSWWTQVTPSNIVTCEIGVSGTTSTLNGATDVADNRWHFVVATYDGSIQRIYLDGALDGMLATPNAAPITSGPAPVNIGSVGADASNNAINPSFGQVAQAFVTADVLSLDQIRFLYCARIPHALGKVPVVASVEVRRCRKGGALALTDFPAVPLHLYNFTSTYVSPQVTADQGSLNNQLGNTPGVPLSGADGSQFGAVSFDQRSYAQNCSQTDAGLPSGTAARSYGCWMKVPANLATSGNYVAIAWGTVSTGDARLIAGYPTVGQLGALSGSDAVSGGLIIDGQWHFAVCTEDNAAVDGVKRKVYLDSKLVAISTVLNPITLVGSGGFHVGCNSQGGGSPFTGSIDSVFVCDYALTGPQIAALYAKGSTAMGAAAKDGGVHIEAMNASAVYASFDTLDTQHQIDLAVGG